MRTWSDAPRAAPHNAPITIRPMNGTGAFRLGVFGSLSLINSPIASTLNTYGVAAKPREASQVFSRCSQPSRAAQLTAAGAVMERSPATTPMKNAKTKVDMSLLFVTRNAAAKHRLLTCAAQLIQCATEPRRSEAVKKLGDR